MMMTGNKVFKLICLLSILLSPGKNVSLEYIKRNTAYNIRKATTDTQWTLNFNRIVVSVFGYDNFLRGNWEMSSVVQEVS